jgi:hypothetical protein
MKRRNGFVSNSSSSSFLIYGINVDGEALIDAVNRLIAAGEIKGRKRPVEDTYDAGEFLDDLTVETPWDEVYIGLSWSTVGDDETGRQFKERAAGLIHKLFPDAKLGTHEHAWRDG